MCKIRLEKFNVKTLLNLKYALFYVNLEDGGEENFSPIQPWRSVLEHTTPTNQPAVDSSLPDESALKLEWIHGYRAHDTRNTVQYTTLGDIVYSVIRSAMTNAI